MKKSLKKMLEGYQAFRERYALGDSSVMQYLSRHGQRPEIMVVACCDSRVDPALILQCDPGDLFVVRNVANIIPPYTTDVAFKGTSAALEFGVRLLKVEHLILLGHTQCGGLEAALNQAEVAHTDFIKNWVSLIRTDYCSGYASDEFAKIALKQSYRNCFTFPWIAEAVAAGELFIHLWLFDIEKGEIFTFSKETKEYAVLDASYLEK
ncbi:MAG: carbonic anhydrase [bacterium]